LKSRIIVGAAITALTAAALAASWLWSPRVLVALAISIVTLIYAEISSWSNKQDKQKDDRVSRIIAAIAVGALGLSTIVAGGITLGFLALSDIGIVVGIFAVAYTTDTSAILTGKILRNNRTIGKREKPLLGFAPSKTLAGFIGAIIGGLTVTHLMVSIDLWPPQQPQILLAPFVVITGDLLGSGFKRIFHVKDSGEVLAEKRETLFSRTLGLLWRGMLPHGGFLDRFGSVLLLSLFLLYVYL